MNAVNESIKSEVANMLTEQFQLQKKCSLDNPSPDYQQRVSDLKALKAMIIDNREEIIQAISADYFNRSRNETLFAEIITVTDGINSIIKSLKKWMKPQKRHVDQTMFFGAKNRVIPQPLGVVGLIIPWNFPINLSFSQLATAFASGNRAMVKMSENSIALTELLISISGNYFPPEKLQFFKETGSVGVEFSQIPFDLIVFTGSGQTGRAVMASAAKNLTPVILELGGKAPAVIDPNYSLPKAVERIMYVKQLNAGQICTNVDYVMVHEAQKDEFIRLAEDYVGKHCPDINSSDYTSIIDDRSIKRLEETIADAEAKGASVINLTSQEVNHAKRKFPLTIVTDTSEDMNIRSRETFGPILMLLTYQQPSDVIEYVNSHDRPLALYPFSNDKQLVNTYIDRIMSGGVTVNDALFHVAQHDIPFGGVGPSGMGHYHGFEGFISFSKLRPIFYQASFSSTKFLAPPYSSFINKVFEFLAKLKS